MVLSGNRPGRWRLSPGCRHTKSHRAMSLFPSMSCLRQRTTEGRSAAHPIVAQACSTKRGWGPSEACLAHTVGNAVVRAY